MYKIRLSSAGDRLLIIRIDAIAIDNVIRDECSEIRVWLFNDRSPVHHWREFEKVSNLCKLKSKDLCLLPSKSQRRGLQLLPSSGSRERKAQLLTSLFCPEVAKIEK